jgi:hypothetical protein
MEVVDNSASATAGIAARLSSTSLGASGKTALGGTITGYPAATVTYSGCDSAYSSGVAAAAIGDVATLTLSSGVIAQTTGTPVITDGDGKDWEGNTIPTLTKLMAIRIRAAAENAAAVALNGSSALLPDMDLHPGADIQLRLPAAGHALSGATLAFTFATIGDAIVIDVLGATA